MNKLIFGFVGLIFLVGCTTEATKQGFECLKTKAIDFCNQHKEEFMGIVSHVATSYVYGDFTKFSCMSRDSRQKKEYLFLSSEIEECRQ